MKATLRYRWSRSWAPDNSRSRRQGRLTCCVDIPGGGVLFGQSIRNEWSVRQRIGARSEIIAIGSHPGPLWKGALEAELSIAGILRAGEYRKEVGK